MSRLVIVTRCRCRASFWQSSKSITRYISAASWMAIRASYVIRRWRPLYSSMTSRMTRPNGSLGISKPVLRCRCRISFRALVPLTTEAALDLSACGVSAAAGRGRFDSDSDRLRLQDAEARALLSGESFLGAAPSPRGLRVGGLFWRRGIVFGLQAYNFIRTITFCENFTTFELFVDEKMATATTFVLKN